MRRKDTDFIKLIKAKTEIRKKSKKVDNENRTPRPIFLIDSIFKEKQENNCNIK
jgi:hypothetical protein